MIAVCNLLAPLLGLLGTGTAWSQLKVSYGAIAGTVLDASGGRVPSASVNARDATRGIERTSTTDQAGEYLLVLLPPGTYEMEFEVPGFAKFALEMVEVRVGDTVVVNARLTIAAHEEEQTVSAASPLIEAQRVQQANAIDAREVEHLPMNQRNYLNLALLAPGVVETASLTDATDFRIPSTPASGLGFAGSNGRGNIFAVDGFGYNGSVGSARPSIPQISIQEFQVNRNSYSAEYGGGFGGAINVVSRTGTNSLHGGGFGYLRQRTLEARDAFAIGDPAFTRVQSGGSLGGPVRKNKTFFLAGFERLDRHESVFVPILQDPGLLARVTPSQDQMLNYLSHSGSVDFMQLSSQLRNLLSPASNPAVTRLFESNSGSFPFAARISRGALRMDHQFSAQSSLMMRFTITADGEQNTQFGAQAGLSRGSSSDQADREVGGEYIRILSPRWMSVTRLGYGHDRFALTPNDPVGPALDIMGYGSFGRDPQLPSTQRDDIIDAQQSLTASFGRHTLNTGVQLYPVRNDVQPETYLGGRFVFSEFLPLGTFIDTVTGDSSYSMHLGQTLTAAGQAQLASSLALPISSLESFALGLPVAYAQGFGTTRAIGWQQRHSAFIEDSWKTKPSLTVNAGIRYQYDSNSHIPGTSYVAPRFGFAWSLNSFVVRGGYGMFPSFTETEVNFSANALRRPDLAILIISAAGVPVINPKTNRPLNSIDIYQTLQAERILGKRTVRFDDLRPLGVLPGFRSPTSGGIADPWEDPYSHQASFEIEKSVGASQISVAYNFSRSLHLPRTRDLNLEKVGTRSNGWPVFGPVDPAIANNYVIEPSANAYYNAMVIQASRRFSRNWSFAAHYTWSKTIDETNDFNIEYTAQNQLDARADRGLSSFNQAHRFVAYGLYRSPTSIKNRLLAGWWVAPILQASSGRPFNILTGFDNLGDGQATTHRPLGLGRNVGRGPDFVSVDARIERDIRLDFDRSAELRFTFEVFNLLNRTNFQKINNIVGATPLSALPVQLEGRRGNPADPFSFTSAYERRQLQLGLQLVF